MKLLELFTVKYIKDQIYIFFQQLNKIVDISELGASEEELKVNLEKFLTPGFYGYIEDEYHLNENTVKKIYFNNNPITMDNKINVTRLFADVCIAQGNLKTIRLQLEKVKTPTYFYIYSYDKTPSAVKELSGIEDHGI